MTIVPDKTDRASDAFLAIMFFVTAGWSAGAGIGYFMIDAQEVGRATVFLGVAGVILVTTPGVYFVYGKSIARWVAGRRKP